MSAITADDDALHFFNRLACTLRIKLGEEPSQVAPNMINLKATKTATITNISITTQVVEGDCEDQQYRDLTEAEWNRVIFRGAVLRLRGEGSKRVLEHSAPDGASFTVRDLIAAILETERQTRPETQWCGGIDIHHIFFSGITGEKGGVRDICWDS
jgi:hypothetical protein